MLVLLIQKRIEINVGLVGKIYTCIKMQLLVRLLRVAVIADLRGLCVRTKLTLTAKKMWSSLEQKTR